MAPEMLAVCQHYTNVQKQVIFKVIHIHAVINSSDGRTNKCTNVKIIFFLHTTCHNSNMFQFILIILMELLNTSKEYTKT
jgi:hypothetical protein